MASTKGAYLKHIRYDSTTPYRIERYLERENWSKEDWRKWIDSHLEEIRIDSNYARAHFNLAMAYDILKNSEAAISHARKAEILYSEKRKHGQVRQVRRYLNVLNEKYRFLKHK